MKKENLSKVLLILVAMIWGSGFPATKIILDTGIQPYEFLAIRFFITAVVMFLIMRVKKVQIEKEAIKLGLVAGIVLFLAFAFQTVGLVYTTASKNAFITGANVIFVPYIAWIFTKEKPKFIYVISSLICFLGLGILSFERDFRINFGDFLTFISAICFALQIVVIGSRIKNRNPFIVNGFQMFSAGIVAILMNILFEGGSILSRSYDLKQVLALGYIIAFNTFICYSIQTYAQREINPSQVSLILTTEIIFGALFSILVLGDKMTLQVIIGGILIFGSVLLTEIKKK
ncbi:MAG: DMT family transporter [Cetobacterium sp.]|uniref:DMT family transporter n=2 Tax=Cetobacterium sp. TaxID=2071632 RepID=UPI003EE56B6D